MEGPILGIDVGGSGIKGALVDTETGDLVTDRVRVPTPSDFGLTDVVDVIAEVAAGLAEMRFGAGDGRVHDLHVRHRYRQRHLH
jgi:polyphosphate glucokinase